MKRIFVLIVTLFFVGCYVQGQSTYKDWMGKVGVRKWSVGKNNIIVRASGLIKDTAQYATKAIQKAIEDCAAKGGGIVSFKPGIYVTGALFLKSNVVLQVDKDVYLLASQHFEDYPKLRSRIAGIEMDWPSALINIVDQKNAGVVGDGKINARGKFCWDKYWAMRKDYDKRGLRWIVDYDAERVRTILVQNSSDVLLKGVQLSNAGFWTVQVLYSNHVTVEGIVIRNNVDGHGPSTDGIDIDSSEWVLVENCDIDCNDDNFCLKAGRDWDGLRVNRPTQYVVIRNSVARRGAGLLTLGSETSGGIKHVYAYNLKAAKTDNGFRIKSATTRGGVLEDITLDGWLLDSVKTVFQCNLNWYPAYSYSGIPKGYTEETMPEHWKTMLKKVERVSKGIPHVTGIVLQNIKATNSGVLLDVNGLDSSLIGNVTLLNSFFGVNSIGSIQYYNNWEFKNIDIKLASISKLQSVLSEEERERLK
ncbi:MAG: glycosyl hydrolase family 28 protein [Chitinophagaceae bacterium]